MQLEFVVDLDPAAGWPAPARDHFARRRGTPKGHLLKADNDEGIRAAFKKVAAMMGGLNEAL